MSTGRISVVTPKQVFRLRGMFNQKQETTMLDLYSAGGIFMTPLTLLGLAALLIAMKKIGDVYVQREEPAAKHRPMVNTVLQLGILSFFLGVLSQAIGLLEAFKVIEQVGTVTPSMLASGIKVSMISSVYGLVILIISFIAWSALKHRLDAMDSLSTQG